MPNADDRHEVSKKSEFGYEYRVLFFLTRLLYHIKAGRRLFRGTPLRLVIFQILDFQIQI
jgi:hypothetical protein